MNPFYRDKDDVRIAVELLDPDNDEDDTPLLGHGALSDCKEDDQRRRIRSALKLIHELFLLM